jgi:hypothetical protein
VVEQLVFLGRIPISLPSFKSTDLDSMFVVFLIPSRQMVGEYIS